MSHSIAHTATGSAPYQITIPNYTSGGETFAAADFQVGAIVGALLGNVPSNQNSLGVPLFPILFGATVKLFQFVSGAPVEIPTTPNLNATFLAIVSFN